MHVVELEKPLVEGVTHWREGGDYLYTVNGHELRLFVANVTEKGIEEFSSGMIDFGLFVDHPVMILLARIEGKDFFECPYSFAQIPLGYQRRPDLGADRATLRLILVEARSGLVKGLRTLKFNLAFTHALHTAINRQAQDPLQMRRFDECLQRLRAKYDSAQLYVRATAHYTTITRSEALI